eukprot:4826051-Ditylum_brightwellii.AAC.1
MKVAKPRIIDAYTEMETLADKVGKSEKNILPSAIWSEVKTELDNTYSGEGYVGHQKHYITKRACRVCAELNNGDVICTVEDTA